MATIRNAPIAWAQRDDLILLTIELDSVKIDELTITPTSFKFKGSTEGVAYESSFDFFADVKEDDIKKREGTRYIELAFNKKEEAWWPRLLKDKVKVHWLKVDFGKWKEEDDSDVEGGMGDMMGGGGGGAGGMNFNNFDLSQYTSQMGGGMPPGLGDDFGDEDEDYDEGDEMPALEDEEEKNGEKEENGKH